MNHSSILNSQVLQFKAIAKNFTDSGFHPQGYVLLDQDAHLDLAVFEGNALPTKFKNELDVALPLSVHAKPSNVVRFFQRSDVLALISRLHAGHNIAWNGHQHVGVFTQLAKDALEVLRRLLGIFNQEAEQIAA